jgi:hypothetical protein
MPVSETGWHTPQDEAIEALFATRMGPHQVPLAQKLQDPMYLQTQGAKTGYGADTVIDTGGLRWTRTWRCKPKEEEWCHGKSCR